MTPYPYLDPDRDEELLQARLRLLGTDDPQCSIPGCLERDPFALNGVHPNLGCPEHRLEAAAASVLEDSHWAGQANLPGAASPIPANDHSHITHRLQPQWPMDTLRNPDGSPLLRAAAALRGWMDTLILIIERACGWIPAFLEGLDAALCIRIGSRWWLEFPELEGAS